MIFVSLHWN